MICSVSLCHTIGMVDDSLEAQGKRLRKARLAAGYNSAAAFAKAMHLNEVTYRAYEAGQNGYAKYAHQFAGRLRVSARWLLEGGDEENKEIEERPENDLEASAKALGLTLVPQLELGYSMGGGSVFNDYRHTGFMPFHRDWLKGMMRGAFADLFVARGEGDSMTPTMLDGDVVLIDTSQQRIEQQDRIWAISYGDLGMIKRVRRLPSGTIAYCLITPQSRRSTPLTRKCTSLAASFGLGGECELGRDRYRGPPSVLLAVISTTLERIERRLREINSSLQGREH